MQTSAGSCLTGLAVGWGLILLGSTAQAQTQPLTGCASESPPFVHMKEGKGVSGFSVDLFHKIAHSMQRDGQIVDLPWARCLEEVRSGVIDVAVDAYDDPERRQLFHYSQPYYTLTPQIFYLASAAPDVLPAPTVERLRRLKGCGLFEYTYEHYALQAKTLDLGATSDKQLLRKLQAKRCDYAVEELEYVVGARRTETDWPDESNIRSYRPAWAQGPQVHYLVGKKRADGVALLGQLNTAIAAMQKQGEIERLGAGYFQTKLLARGNPPRP